MQSEMSGIVILLFVIIGLCIAFKTKSKKFALIYGLGVLLLGGVFCYIHFNSQDHISSSMSQLSDLHGVMLEAFEHEHNDLSDLKLLDSDHDTTQIGQCDIILHDGVISNLQFTAIYSKNDLIFEKLFQINYSKQLFSEKKNTISNSAYIGHTISVSDLDSCLQKLDSFNWLYSFDLTNEESVNLSYCGKIGVNTNQETSIPVYVYCQDELILHETYSSVITEDNLYHSFMLVSKSKSLCILFPVNAKS